MIKPDSSDHYIVVYMGIMFVFILRRNFMKFGALFIFFSIINNAYATGCQETYDFTEKVVGNEWE
jgi:hypothetical protein